MASVPTRSNDDNALNFAKQAIKSELTDKVEEEILALIKPKIRALALGAVAAFAVKEVRLSREQGTFNNIDNMLVTFVENVVVNQTKEITIKEV